MEGIHSVALVHKKSEINCCEKSKKSLKLKFLLCLPSHLHTSGHTLLGKMGVNVRLVVLESHRNCRMQLPQLSKQLMALLLAYTADISLYFEIAVFITPVLHAESAFKLQII